jgi:hypothetical protein
VYTPHSLSSYIRGGAVAVGLAAGVICDSPLGLISFDQLTRREAPQPIAVLTFANTAATENLYRFGSRDRLPEVRADSMMNATVIQRTVVAPEQSTGGKNRTSERPSNLGIDGGKRNSKQESAPLIACEALASLISDPILSRFIRRCFA